MSFGITVGVWTISGMRLLYDAGEHDGRIYSASIVALAVLAAVGAATMLRLDAHSVGQLSRRQDA
jgi:hypothetical protein